ncbi:MAG TPA: RpiB/LacA/LacB family sugar-phosphate isomerase [Terracidiphilus sp.]|nr:RpiB/LacA/LacB family sugar-phosphate isomerase [Terracidiphilus sp.]
MKLVISSDHAGFPLKEDVRANLTAAGHEMIDLGACKVKPEDDYPDFAEKVGEAIKAGVAPRGILICGSGVGVCVAANKIPGIRAGICHDTYSAHQGVEHDDMNVLVLGARIIGPSLAYELAHAFIDASFQAKEPRFQRRLRKVLAIEAKYLREIGSKGEEAVTTKLELNIGMNGNASAISR